MGYEAFKEVLLTELKNFYGKDADVITIKGIQNAAGQYFEGIDILLRDVTDRGSHTINISILYDNYTAGEMDIYDCVEFIYREQEGGRTEQE